MKQHTSKFFIDFLPEDIKEQILKKKSIKLNNLNKIKRKLNKYLDF